MVEGALPPYDDSWPALEPGEYFRRAAVLILLYPKAGEDYIVFTRRTEQVEHHKGQISLPGGGEDPEDEGPASTALREAYEEIGLDPSAVQVLAVLPDIFARISSFVIAPVVGRLKPEAAPDGLVFKPNPDEVAEIIEVPLHVLQDPSIHRVEARVTMGRTYNIHFYRYGPYEIWGVTGRIMYEFLRDPRAANGFRQTTATRKPTTDH